MRTIPAENNDALAFPDRAIWSEWLQDHASISDGVWLRIGKKGTKLPLMGIEDAGDEAICFGWIDSHRKGLDKDSFLQRYSPRRSKSPWSKKNVDRAEALIVAGRMRPAGFAEIEAAKRDGRWEIAYVPQKDFQVPQDVEDAFEIHPRARAAFDLLGKSKQYLLLLPIIKETKPGKRVILLKKLMGDLLDE
jgi:uncharacterized protein YdeI (YjbR/CyaY-like superfamily)